MIVLGWPSRNLSPNGRPHHYAKGRAVKKARAEAFWATREAKVAIAAGDLPVLLDITFLPPCRRHRDRDNLLSSIKAHLDGIADALGVNDSAFRHNVIVGDPVKGGRVEVVVRTHPEA